MSRRKVCDGEVYDFSDPYWRVSYPNGGLEELNGQELNQGRELATASA